METKPDSVYVYVLLNEKLLKPITLFPPFSASAFVLSRSSALFNLAYRNHLNLYSQRFPSPLLLGAQSRVQHVLLRSSSFIIYGDDLSKNRVSFTSANDVFFPGRVHRVRLEFNDNQQVA